MNPPVSLPLPPSLYAETTPAPRPTRRRSTADKTVSVAVIGGGFTGLSAALHLAEQGTDVVVLEAHEPGWGASGRNGGAGEPGAEARPRARWVRDFGPDLGERMVAMSRWNATNTAFDIIRKHQIQCDASQSGTIRAAWDAAQASPISTAPRMSRAPGGACRSRFLDAAGGCARVTGTDRCICAGLDTRGGHVNPLGYARGLAQAAIQAGAVVHGATPAGRKGLARRRQLACPDADRHGACRPARARHQRLHRQPLARPAQGPWCRCSAVFVASEPLPDAMARDIFPTRSALYKLGKVTTYYRLDRAEPRADGWAQREAQHPIEGPEALGFLRGATPSGCGRVMKGIRWTHGWNGQLAVTTDFYPHIHEPAPEVTVSLGYNGRGVAMASAMGAAVDPPHPLGGAQAEIDMPVTGIKPMPLHAFWPVGVTAAVLAGRVRDQLGSGGFVAECGTSQSAHVGNIHHPCTFACVSSTWRRSPCASNCCYRLESFA